MLVLVITAVEANVWAVVRSCVPEMFTAVALPAVKVFKELADAAAFAPLPETIFTVVGTDPRATAPVVDAAFKVSFTVVANVC